MDFVMSGREKLEAVVSRLRGAGFENASESDSGDQLHVVSVSAESDEDTRLISELVRDVDPESKPL